MALDSVAASISIWLFECDHTHARAHTQLRFVCHFFFLRAFQSPRGEKNPRCKKSDNCEGAHATSGRCHCPCISFNHWKNSVRVFCWIWLDCMCMCLRCSSITSFESHLNVFIHQNALHAHRATTLDHYYYVQIKMTKLFAQKYIYKNVLSHDHTERNSTCECECVDNNEYMRTIFSFHSSSSSSLRLSFASTFSCANANTHKV